MRGDNVLEIKSGIINDSGGEGSDNQKLRIRWADPILICDAKLRSALSYGKCIV